VKKKLRIKFTDFWADMNEPEQNDFYQLLARHWDVEFSDQPDILFFSCFGTEYLKYKCIRIFFSPENWRPDFNGCDFAITFDYNNDPRHYRFPLWASYYIGLTKRQGFHEFSDRPDREAMRAKWKDKSKFCCFIVSNPSATKRINFFRKLNAAKKVDSAGKHLNNIGRSLEPGTLGKLNFIKDYRFVISFENSAHAGYTTEKLIEPLLVDAIPIYWGDPEVGRDFNTKRFLNHDDFPSENALVERIMAIEKNPELALDMLTQPVFSNKEISIAAMEKGLEDFLLKAVEKGLGATPVAQKPLRSIGHRYNITKKKMIGRLSRLK
jgi:hypothetical protein